MKKYLFFLTFALTNSSAFAQAGLADLFTKSFEIVNEKSGKDKSSKKHKNNQREETEYSANTTYNTVNY